MNTDIHISSRLSNIPSYKHCKKYSCDQIKNEIVTGHKSVNKRKSIHRALSASNLIMKFPNKKRNSGKCYLTKKDFYY